MNWIEFEDERTDYQKEFARSMERKMHELKYQELRLAFKPLPEVIPSKDIYDYIVKNDLITRWTMQNIYWLSCQYKVTKDGKLLPYNGTLAASDLVGKGFSKDLNGFLVANNEQMEIYKDCFGTVQECICNMIENGLLHLKDNSQTELVFELEQKKGKDGEPLKDDDGDLVQISSYYRLNKAIKKALLDNKHFQLKDGIKQIVTYVPLDVKSDENGDYISERLISDKTNAYFNRLVIDNHNDILDDAYSKKGKMAFAKIITLFDGYLKSNYPKDYDKLHKVWYSFFDGGKNIVERSISSGLNKNTQSKYERMILGVIDKKTKRRTGGIVDSFKSTYNLMTIFECLPNETTKPKKGYNSSIYHNPLGNRYSNLNNKPFAITRDIEKVLNGNYREYKRYSYLDDMIKNIATGRDNIYRYKPVGFDDFIWEKPIKRKYELMVHIMERDQTLSKPLYDDDRWYYDIVECIRDNKGNVIKERLIKREIKPEKIRWSKAMLEKIKAAEERQKALDEMYLNGTYEKHHRKHHIDYKKGMVQTLEDGIVVRELPIYKAR